VAAAHVAIVAAIAARAPEAARRAMERHLLDLQRRLLPTVGGHRGVTRSVGLGA
jgi:DNA-binding FadR family transcriptional regulator